LVSLSETKSEEQWQSEPTRSKFTSEQTRGYHVSKYKLTDKKKDKEYSEFFLGLKGKNRTKWQILVH